ncbi:MAG: hypothetical protein VKJ04_04575 [Vampirovibrionales bacterium]|nr:hypothetical protein [Vampirovibrionales bacterium]
MKKSHKLLLMFLPITLLLLSVVVVTLDIKHPDIRHHQCEVLASGLNASQYRNGSNMLYTSSGQKIHDVALRCPLEGKDTAANGIVLINDFDVFVSEVAPGDSAEVIHKRFRILPDRWLINIRHIKSIPPAAG